MRLQDFPKSNRLLSKGDFSHLKQNSNSAKSQWIMAFYKESLKDSISSRIGISVSKKVGNAVKRNLVKRHIRDYFRKSDFRELGKDVLIVVHPKLYFDLKTPIIKKLNNSLDQIFKRICLNENHS